MNILALCLTGNMSFRIMKSIRSKRHLRSSSPAFDRTPPCQSTMASSVTASLSLNASKGWWFCRLQGMVILPPPWEAHSNNKSPFCEEIPPNIQPELLYFVSVDPLIRFFFSLWSPVPMFKRWAELAALVLKVVHSIFLSQGLHSTLHQPQRAGRHHCQEEHET